MTTSSLGQTCFCFGSPELLVPGVRDAVGSHFQMLLQQLPTSLFLQDGGGTAVWTKGLFLGIGEMFRNHRGRT